MFFTAPILRNSTDLKYYVPGLNRINRFSTDLINWTLTSNNNMIIIVSADYRENLIMKEDEKLPEEAKM